MSDFLETITAETRKRVAMLKQTKPLNTLAVRPKEDLKRPFAAALLQSEGIGLIAELKQASPSAGVIRTETDLPARLMAYERGGAAALSILTEESYFHGSSALLALARQKTKLPLLRKDFIIDAYQISESRSLGADAILLIVAILSDADLKSFLSLAKENDLDVLVEVHSEAELARALAAGASLIGINNRDLHSLKVDPETAPRLLARIPKQGVTVVVESGIKDPAELPRLRRLGARAVLIGETLMRDPNSEAMVRRFVEAGHHLEKTK